MKLLGICVFFIIFSKPIYSIKFGFLLDDEMNVFNEKFVAFGSLPADVTGEQMIAVSNNLNNFYRYERKARTKKSISESRSSGPGSPLKFQVTLLKQTLLEDGNYQVSLTGELSNFLALFRFTMINALQVSDIWKSANFYWDPIVIMSPESFEKAPKDLKVTLLRAAFDNFDTVVHNNLRLIEPGKARTFADLAIDFDYVKFNDFNEDEEDSEEEDKGRFTVFDFFSSTGSLRDPAADSPPKNSLKSKFLNRKKKKFNCCSRCTIS